MKSPKDIRRESKSMMGWFVFCVVVFVLALGVAVWLALPSSNQTTTRAAIAQLSKVQPGDTLYWFDGPVRQLAVIRNIPEQQVIETVESELIGLYGGTQVSQWWYARKQRMEEEREQASRQK